MPPRSPTHAFDPTPALEHDPDNFSPVTGEDEMNSLMGKPQFKEVHFSDAPMPIVARHSIATTTVPLLPSVSSASQIPKQTFRPGPPGIDVTAYIENCRNLNEQLRQAHDTERKAWDIERAALQARIADLEFSLNKSRDFKRRSSNDSSSASALSFRSDFRNTNDTSRQSNLRKVNSEPLPPSATPIWRGPETTPPVTRVFTHDDSDVNHLPSISEDAEPFPDLSKEISPTTKEERPSIDVSEVDHTLDGITLRSTGPAITSSFVTKITSPQFGSPSHSPSPRPQNRPPANTLANAPNNLNLDVTNLLDPLDKKLKLHAGHTPMALDGTVMTSENPTEVPTPREDAPPEPAPTKRPPLRPSEDSDSYFSLSESVPQVKQPEEALVEEEEPEPQPEFEPQDDPTLQGPLMLDHSASSSAANAFLEKVDAKLTEVAAHSRLRSDTSTTTTDSEAPPTNDQAETNGEGHVKNKESMDDLPKLKIRKSTNFGSAWGGDMPGRI